MAQRITQSDVASRVRIINNQYARLNISKYVQLSGRYDYQALDMYTDETCMNQIQTLYCGTYRELYIYLGGMIEGFIR